MMWQLRALVILLSHVLISFPSQAVSLPVVADSQIGKRWFSVPLDKDALPVQQKAWPARLGAGKRPITYCFAGEHAFSVLGPIFFDAVEKWAPAVQVSSLVFIPDPICSGPNERKCICRGRMSEPTLHIELGRDRRRADAGYAIDLETGKTELRHIEFRRSDNRDEDVLCMAHEIGHVIGLYHENNRPDASEYVHFDCTALEGYEPAKARVLAADESDPMLPTGASIDDRMEKVCSNVQLATRYMPSAFPFMPWGAQQPNPYDNSAFDFNSIMMLSSKQGNKNKKPMYALLRRSHHLRQPGTKPTDPINLIWEGGNQDPRLAGPSPSDIERVKTLYPKAPRFFDSESKLVIGKRT